MRTLIQGKHGPQIIDLNRRKAVRERCLNCTGWSVKEVTACEFVDCHLYAFRSGKGKQNAKARDKTIREFCLWCMNGQRLEVKLCPSQDCPLYPYRKSTTDRTQDMPDLQKKRHIEAVSEDKTESEYKETLLTEIGSEIFRNEQNS